MCRIIRLTICYYFFFFSPYTQIIDTIPSQLSLSPSARCDLSCLTVSSASHLSLRSLDRNRRCFRCHAQGRLFRPYSSVVSLPTGPHAFPSKMNQVSPCRVEVVDHVLHKNWWLSVGWARYKTRFFSKSKQTDTSNENF